MGARGEGTAEKGGRGAVWGEGASEASLRPRAAGERPAGAAAAAGTGERGAPPPARGARLPPALLRASLRRASRAWAFAAGSWRGVFSSLLLPSPPLFLSLFLLLGGSTPPGIRRGGARRAAAANSRRARLRTPGEEPRGRPLPAGALSARPRAAPRHPRPLFPLLQSHGILRMPERWR